MLQIAEATWECLWEDPEFRDEVAGFEARRKAAAKASWVRPCIGSALALAVFIAFRPDPGEFPVGIAIVVLTILAITWAASRNVVRRTDREMEGRLVAAMARHGGFEFLKDYFSPPGLTTEMEGLLGGVEKRRFICLVSAIDGPMAGASTYALEGSPARRFYKVRRGRHGEGTILIFPRATRFGPDFDRSWFQPIDMGDDPGFARRFEVYASVPGEAGSTLSPALQGLLAAMAEHGPVRAFIGPELALVVGPDPLRSRKAAARSASAEEVAQAIVRQFGAILGTLRDLRAQLA